MVRRETAWRANVLLALASLLLIALFTEGLLRATHLFGARVAYVEPASDIGWRFTPNRHYWFSGENDHPIQGRINSMGWRDRERTREKPGAGYRIAVIGDSFVEAFQVELDSTFLAIAERELNARSPARRVECMNFGRSGMTTTEESIVLDRDVLPCHPDAVVLLFMPGNDIADIAPGTADNTIRPFPLVQRDGSIAIDYSFAASRGQRVRAFINPLKQHSALVSLITERYNAWRRTPAPHAPGGPRAMSRELALCTAHSDSLFRAQYSLNKRLMVDMVRRCDAAGTRMWLMSVPVVRRGGEAASLRAIDGSFDPGRFDKDLAALADTLGAGFIPLAARFEAAGPPHGPGLFWGHWNYAGHRVVADAVVGGLEPVIEARASD